MEIKVSRVTIGETDTPGNMQITFPGNNQEMLNVHCDAIMLLCDLIGWQNTMNRGTLLEWEDVQDLTIDGEKTSMTREQYTDARAHTKYIQTATEMYLHRLVEALRLHALFPITLTIAGGNGVERAI